MMRRRWDSVGRFWFFSHFSTDVSVIPIANISASLRGDKPRSTRFWRRYSPRVLGATGKFFRALKCSEIDVLWTVIWRW